MTVVENRNGLNSFSLAQLIDTEIRIRTYLADPTRENESWGVKKLRNEANEIREQRLKVFKNTQYDLDNYIKKCVEFNIQENYVALATFGLLEGYEIGQSGNWDLAKIIFKRVISDSFVEGRLKLPNQKMLVTLLITQLTLEST